MSTQEAPYPEDLRRILDAFSYRPGWLFNLAVIDRGQGSKGLTLDVTTKGYNSYHPERGYVYCVHHYMPVPPASYNRASWMHWLLQQCILIERHEACEFFVVDGEHPFAPHHGPGNDPYIIWMHGEDEDRRTSFLGEVKDD